MSWLLVRQTGRRLQRSRGLRGERERKIRQVAHRRIANGERNTRKHPLDRVELECSCGERLFITGQVTILDPSAAYQSWEDRRLETERYYS